MISHAALTKQPITPTAASLLGFLYEGPQTGWDLVKIAQERIGNFWSLTKSQVYSELDKLAKEELVSVSERGSREKRTFTINSKGKILFREWINKSPSSEHIRFPLLLSVSFGKHIDSDVFNVILRTHLERHLQQLQIYQDLYEKITSSPNTKDAQLTLSFGIEYEMMTIKWIKTVIKSQKEEE